MTKPDYYVVQRIPCERCKGSGESPLIPGGTCIRCDGTGGCDKGHVPLREALTEVLPDVLANLGINSEVVSK